MARMLLALAAVAALLALGAPAALGAGPQGVLVRFAKGADARERTAARAEAGTRFRQVLPVRGLQLVQPEPGVSARTAIDRLERSPEVLYAEPDLIRKASATPNDGLFGLTWGMRNTGQSVEGVSGTPGADISAPAAWDRTTGSAAVTVGIVDSGVDATHPDLAPNIWTNPNEIPGNGIDDDGNGLVDDVRGWDWVGGSANPADQNGHGTHVSGTVGARGNDGTGVAGVSWNVKLAALRVLDANGNGSTSNVIKAYAYASQKGFRVVNASFGGAGYSNAEHDALAAAGNTLFVAAAGNAGVDNDVTPTYPCSYDLANVICVAATDQNDNLASFGTGGSNYGSTSVDLGAPGKNILSAWPAFGCAPQSPPCWAYSDGTSMATPHVSGAAALLFSQDPGASLASVRSALLGSVDPKPSLQGKTVTGGRLNVARALAAQSPSGAGGGSGAPAPGAAASGGAGSGGGPAATPAPPRRPPASSPAAKPDRTPPSVTVAIARQRIGSVLRRGLLLRVRCSEPCAVRADMLLGAAPARRLGLRTTARHVLVGRSRRGSGTTGRFLVRVRPDARARRALRRARSLNLRLLLRAVDRQDNARVLSRLVLLR